MINCPALKNQIKRYFLLKLEDAQREFVRLTEIIEKEIMEDERGVVTSSEAEIQLDKIMIALQRLKTALSNPNFGTCTCGNGIEVARLNADPSTTLCVKCAPPVKIANILQFKKSKGKENATTSNA